MAHWASLAATGLPQNSLPTPCPHPPHLLELALTHAIAEEDEVLLGGQGSRGAFRGALK